MERSLRIYAAVQNARCTTGSVISVRAKYMYTKRPSRAPNTLRGTLGRARNRIVAFGPREIAGLSGGTEKRINRRIRTDGPWNSG